MAHYRDEHMVQSDEELRHLEDEHDRGRDREGDRGRGRGPDLRELPQPIYRIKATHSNETFYAYFVVPSDMAFSGQAPRAPAEDGAAEADARPRDEELRSEAFPAPAIETFEPRQEIHPDAPPSPGSVTGSASEASAESPESIAAEIAALPFAVAEGSGGGVANEGSAGSDAAGEDAKAGGATDVSAADDGAAGDGAAGDGAVSPDRPFAIPPRTMVIAPTRYGRDLCELQGPVATPGSVGHDEIVRIERIATPEDIRKYEANRERERKAFETCKQKIAARNLPMKLVAAHYLLEEPKVLFYFSAETRVDFRELVKDLVAVFKMRIGLRQIGVRDEARVTGGCGVCGRVLCCHGVTDKLVPVSIKMAKDQNLSLNSMKISGPCGRLLCCLAYEYGFYRDARRELPNEGARFPYDGTLFRVIEVNALAGSVKIAGEDGRLLDMPAARFAYSEGRWQVRQEE